jgi:hypothetical protein
MTRTRRCRHLALESLEARDTPAGVVDVTFLGGSLTLVGDETANGIAFGRDAGASVRLVISATDGNTTFRLNGLTPQASVTLPAAVTGDITIRAGAGNDSVLFRDVSVPGSLRIFGGEGDNTLTVRDSLNVGQNLTVINGSGYDQMSILASAGGQQSQGRLDVGGKATINNQAGGSAFVCEAGARLKASSLSWTNGEGFDRTDLLGEIVATGGLSIRNGPGGSLLQGGFSTDIKVDGGLSVTSGTGIDTITLVDAYRIKAGSISIRQGPDRSETTLAGSREFHVGGNLAVVGGPAFDRVQVGTSSMPTVVDGNVQINLGAGGSDVNLYGSTVTVNGGIGVRAGTGQDAVTISSDAAGPVGKSVAVSLGSGDNQSVYVAGLTIAGSLRVGTAALPTAGPGDVVNVIAVTVGLRSTITTGAASDQVGLSDCVFTGSILVSTGAGQDLVGINATGIPGTIQFNAPVTVLTGDGDDSIVVGYYLPWYGPWAWAEFADTATFNGGRGTGDHITLEPGNTFNGPQPVLTGFES